MTKMPEWMLAWLYAPEEEWTPEQELKAHKEILAEIERNLRWYRYIGESRKVAELEKEAKWRRSEIERLKEEIKRTA